MSRQVPKKYTDEFKREAVRQLVTRGARLATEVAEELRVNEISCIGGVRSTGRRSDLSATTAKSGKRTAEQKELEALCRESSRVEEGQCVLEKGSGLLREGDVVSPGDITFVWTSEGWLPRSPKHRRFDQAMINRRRDNPEFRRALGFLA